MPKKNGGFRDVPRATPLLAVAMTEPGAGSDLQAIRTKAVRDGDSYVINGPETFISNGVSCDLVIVACKTDPDAVPAHKGMSLLLVEDGWPGFTKGKKAQKDGTVFARIRLNFTSRDCRVPKENLLGEEGLWFWLFDAEIATGTPRVRHPGSGGG